MSFPCGERDSPPGRAVQQSVAVGAEAVGVEAQRHEDRVRPHHGDGRADGTAMHRAEQQDDVAEAAQPFVLPVERVVRVLDGPSQEAPAGERSPGCAGSRSPAAGGRRGAGSAATGPRRNGISASISASSYTSIIWARAACRFWYPASTSAPLHHRVTGPARRVDPVRRLLGPAQQLAYAVGRRALVRPEALGDRDVEPRLQDLDPHRDGVHADLLLAGSLGHRRPLPLIWRTS